MIEITCEQSVPARCIIRRPSNIYYYLVIRPKGIFAILLWSLPRLLP